MPFYKFLFYISEFIKYGIMRLFVYDMLVNGKCNILCTCM